MDASLGLLYTAVHGLLILLVPHALSHCLRQHLIVWLPDSLAADLKR